jgi:vancomycin resistance protein YoaR
VSTTWEAEDPAPPRDPTGPRALARARIRRRRRRRRVGVAVLGAVLAAAVLAAVLGRPYGSQVPPGVRVGGLALGGRSDRSASAALQAEASAAIARGLVVTSGSERQRMRLARLDLRADTVAALHGAHDAYGFFGRIEARLGLAPGASVPLQLVFDGAALDREIDRLGAGIVQAAEPASVRIADDGTFHVVNGRGGIVVDRAAVRARVASLPTLHGVMELPLRRVPPPASAASAREAVARAQTLLGVEHDLRLAGHDYPFPGDALRRAIVFVPDHGVLRMRLARPPIAAAVRQLFGAAETLPENARFQVDGGERLGVVPSRDGHAVDPESIRSTLEANPALREVPVRIANVKPTFSTADAQHLGVTDEVSSFTTPYAPGEPRVTNIQRAAELLDGSIVKAGGTFDLNARLGERTLERGFVVAPMIDEGRLRDAVGGGVSQIATTLYNAAFFAGLKLVAHTPHAFYIERYPPGREATVSWGGPELVFQNDWQAPLVILVHAASDHVTVRMFSRKLQRKVEQGTGIRTDEKPAKTQKIVNPKLAPGQEHVIQHGGEEGFAITYWRKVYRGSALIANERYSAHYRPEDTIIEVGPKPQPPPPTGSTGTTGSTGPTTSGGGATTGGTGTDGGLGLPPTGT